MEECAGTQERLGTTAPCLFGSEPSCCSDQGAYLLDYSLVNFLFGIY